MTLQIVVSVLVVGSIYALIALGFSLVLGTLKVIDFAYGGYVVLAAYLAYWLGQTVFTSGPWGALLCILVATSFSALVGALVWVALQSLLDKSHLVQLVATFGISTIITGVLLNRFGTGVVMAHFSFAQQIIPIGSARIVSGRLIAAVMGLVAIGIATWVLTTRLGLMVRSVAAAPKGAALVGINISLVRIATVALGAALGGLAGSLLILFFPIGPVDGMRFLLIAFFAVAIGGLGSLPGAIVASFLIALIEILSQNFAPGFLKNALPYLIVFVIVALMPAGFANIRRSMARVG